jgi:hypothetical protein
MNSKEKCSRKVRKNGTLPEKANRLTEFSTEKDAFEKARKQYLGVFKFKLTEGGRKG